MEMVGKEGLRTGVLNLSFGKLMMVGGGENSGKGVNLKAGVITDWKDIPVELLMQILSLVDDQTVIIASEVCRGWREAICFGLTRLSLSWCSKNMNNLVLSLTPKFTKLQTLILRQDKPQLEDNAVASIANFCHDLQILDLSKSFKLTDRSLYAIALGCWHLTKLNISGCSAFSDSALAYLASLCRELKVLNLCGCVKAASDTALQAIGRYCNQLQSLNLGWCENVSDVGVTSLAYGCPDLRTLDLCGCVLITDDSVIALANRCPHLRSLGLYYCQNITDRAMYSLAQSKVKNRMWGSVKGGNDEDGLRTLNISQCTALTPSAVQAVCDSSPALHTCSGRHSLIMSGCLSLTSVHCACAVQAHRGISTIPNTAH
ncbi:F-box protein SKP2B [Vigna radiata var. radiata]|uniref:F-box protein SKP2B n=1 Tax=Vigna radiata var. radiata TaxID=3916 RepID=A0A1S3U9F0_VIGRR|nr:F-box protein SKP2B [Vigna radiata var. radiata]